MDIGRLLLLLHEAALARRGQVAWLPAAAGDGRGLVLLELKQVVRVLLLRGERASADDTVLLWMLQRTVLLRLFKQLVSLIVILVII